MKLCVTRKDHYIGEGGKGGHYIDDFCFHPSVRTLFNHGSSSMSTGTEQIHEYSSVPEVFSRVLRSSAAEMFRVPPFFLSHARRSDSTLSCAPSSSQN